MMMARSWSSNPLPVLLSSTRTHKAGKSCKGSGTAFGHSSIRLGVYFQRSPVVALSENLVSRTRVLLPMMYPILCFAIIII